MAFLNQWKLIFKYLVIGFEKVGLCVLESQSERLDKLQSMLQIDYSSDLGFCSFYRFLFRKLNAHWR